MTTKNIEMTKKITLENAGKEPVAFRYFRVNFAETLQPEDKVVLTAGSSEEAAYYLALADAEKGLVVTAVDAE